MAIIPARGGSKGIPGKNTQTVGGVPLIQRAVHAASGARSVHRVYVSTDDPEISALAVEAGALVVDRPAEIAGDTASSEAAILHTLQTLAESGVRPEITVFIQATSPFISPEDIDAAVERVERGWNDSVFSAVETYEFLWRDDDGTAVGVNHDHSFRPRRQDREPHYRETGAFYVFRTAGFVEAGFRFFGSVGVVEVDPATAVEIDEPADLEICRALAPALDRGSSRAIDADVLVTDFDGVHTDDTVTVTQDGVESVRVSRSDGMGVSLLKQAGIRILILSTEVNPVVAARARKLDVEVLHGQEDKGAALKRWADAEGIDLDRVAYLGNDANDLACFRLVGWPVAVANSHPSALSAARRITAKPGGAGAVREVADMILSARKEKN